MNKYTLIPFPLLLVLSAAGCSGNGGGSDSGQATDALPSAAPPVAGESPAPPPAGSAPSNQPRAIVVYAENESVLGVVGADGRQRAVIAGDATYRGATEDGWVIVLQGTDLVSVRIADGTSRILDDTPGSKHFRAVFDTNYVVYEKHTADGQSSLHLVRADGSARLVPAAARPRPLAFIAVTPARRILYELCESLIGDDDGLPCTDRDLLSARLDGSDERLVLAGAPLIRHITDDDLVVYDRDTDSGTVVSIVKSDGSGGRTLSEADSFFAGELPNGRIVYNRDAGGQLDLYSVAADGTSTRALATSGEDEFYAGATPGGRVLFLRGSPQRRLYSVDESTGDIRTLQVAGDSNVRAMAADGTVIVSSRFGADTAAEDNLYSVRADGTGLRALADSSDMEWFEALAPDGRVIYRRCMAAPAGPCAHPSAQSDLYSVNQNATGTVALAASGAFEVARAVTNDNLVVYEVLEANQSDLYSVPTTGGRAEPLANTGNDERFLTVIAEGTIGERRAAHPDL